MFLLPKKKKQPSQKTISFQVAHLPDTVQHQNAVTMDGRGFLFVAVLSARTLAKHSLSGSSGWRAAQVDKGEKVGGKGSTVLRLSGLIMGKPLQVPLLVLLGLANKQKWRMLQKQFCELPNHELQWNLEHCYRCLIFKVPSAPDAWNAAETSLDALRIGEKKVQDPSISPQCGRGHHSGRERREKNRREDKQCNQGKGKEGGERLLSFSVATEEAPR